MRDYELTFITHPDLNTEALNEMVQRVQTWITDAGGSISKVDQWGKRTLSYSIRKQKEGQYVYIEMSMPAKFAGELERNLRFLEAVMRFLLIVKDEKKAEVKAE
jgi:small subunit ribosomal protein S6